MRFMHRMYMQKKEYCCIDMENRIIKNIVHCTNLVHNLPEMDTYYIEVVKEKKYNKKGFGLWENVEVISEDIILYYCCFCGTRLN